MPLLQLLLLTILGDMENLDFETLLVRYQSGELHFRNVIVDYADGFECNLRGCDLQHSVFTRAYLPYSNLSQAMLQGFVIREGNLCDIRLMSADLTDAILSGVKLARADLRYACLKRASLQSCNLAGADLRGADLSEADLSNATLTSANLSNICSQRLCLKGANLFRANGVDLEQAICDRATILPDGHYYE